jgi:twinkle protein
MSKANFVKHDPCPKCGSSDANAVYDDGSSHCFSCGHHVFASDDNKEKVIVEKPKKALYYEGEFRPLTERKIDETTAKFFKVKKDDKGNIIYPLYNRDGEVVATKIRRAGDDKSFAISGDFAKSTLFGMHCFGTGGKYLTIVEGQDDAMAAYKMMGSKWAVISVHSASSAVKDVLANIDYIESFEKIKLVFDSDEVGRKAAMAVAEKLSPGKAEIVSLQRYKDANDYLRAGSADKFQAEWWESKTFTPAGIKSFSDIFEEFESRVNTEIIPLPDFLGHVKYMFNGGLARGEITTVVGDTSIGKTTFVNNLIAGILEASEDSRVLYLGLETTLGELVAKMLSMHLEQNVEGSGLSMSELRDKFNDIPWKDRLKIVDHRGSIDPEELLQKIRNAIVAFDCNVVVIDPLQQALPNSENDTVRQFMDSLLKLASQTKAAFLLTSHVRKRDTKNAHDISEDDALGSSAIKQVSFNLILASRDKLSDNEVERSSIKLVVAKNRRVGRTGEGSWLFYNDKTLRLEEGSDPREFDE